MRRVLSGLVLAATVTAATPRAEACGGLFGATEKPLYNDAIMVALLREGTRTIVTLRNSYEGPPEAFALVVPVPVVLQKEQVETVLPGMFTALENATAPRLVDLWERDPCAPPENPAFNGNLMGDHPGDSFGGGGLGMGGSGSVKVENAFETGEYQLTVLSATESDALESWLVGHGYRVPPGAAAALAPYVKEQWKFFVARVDPGKLHKDPWGRTLLSPLRFQYESSDFRFPLRLSLLNARAAQDLVVFVVGRSRYEAANHPNVFVPTNLEVTADTRKRFEGFYGRLFDATVARANGHAMVTEYAAPTDKCEDCPGVLRPWHLAAFGGSLLWKDLEPPLNGGVLYEESPKIEGKVVPEAIKRILRANFPRYRACLQEARKRDKDADGLVTSHILVDETGAVTSASVDEKTKLAECIVGVMRTLSFPEPESGQAKITYPLRFVGPTTQPPPPPPPLVITRLHMRYAPQSIDSDLILREAPPVEGGSFVARSVIRHPWKGPIACAEPKKGIWETRYDTPTLGAMGIATEERRVPLAKSVVAGLDDVKQWDRAAPKAPGAPKPTIVRRRTRACHCSVPGSNRDEGALVPLAAFVVTISAARLRSASSRRRRASAPPRAPRGSR